MELVAQPIPIISAKPKPTFAKAIPLVAKPVVRVAAALPTGARPAAGMAKLDALIQKASLMLMKPEIPVLPVLVMPIVELEIPTIQPLAPKSREK